MKRDQMTNEQLCELAKQGNADAQNLLIENNLRFIKKTAYEVWSAQAELNRSLRISLDDLAQEGSLGLFGCIDSYNPDSGNLFLTYAAPAIRNAMIDYICSQNVSFEAKNLNSIISLDELAKDEVRSRHNFIADPTCQTPEQIGEAVAQSVSHLPGVDTEMVKQMFLAMAGTVTNHEKRPDDQ